MKWTKKQPVLPGFYWWRRPDTKEMIIKLEKRFYSDELDIFCIGSNTAIPLIAAHKSCEWLGSIKPSEGK